MEATWQENLKKEREAYDAWLKKASRSAKREALLKHIEELKKELDVQWGITAAASLHQAMSDLDAFGTHLGGDMHRQHQEAESQAWAEYKRMEREAFDAYHTQCNEEHTRINRAAERDDALAEAKEEDAKETATERSQLESLRLKVGLP